MKKIRVHTPFTFNNIDHTKTKFAAGIHQVADEVADHWFVQRYAEPLDKTTSDDDLSELITALQAQITDLTAQVTAAAAALIERDASIAEKDQQITDLTAQVTALTEKPNGAKK